MPAPPGDAVSMQVDSSRVAPVLPSLLASAAKSKLAIDTQQRKKLHSDLMQVLTTADGGGVPSDAARARQVAEAFLFNGVVIFAAANEHTAFEISRDMELDAFYQPTLPASPSTDSSQAVIMLSECIGMFQVAQQASTSGNHAARLLLLGIAMLTAYCKRAVEFIYTRLNIARPSTAQPALLPDVMQFADEIYRRTASAVQDPSIPSSPEINAVASTVSALSSAELTAQVHSSKYVTANQLRVLSYSSSAVATNVTPTSLTPNPSFEPVFQLLSGAESQQSIQPLNEVAYLIVLAQLDVFAAHAALDVLQSMNALEGVRKMVLEATKERSNPVTQAVVNEQQLQTPDNAKAYAEMILRAFVMIWLPLRHGFSFRPATQNFAPEMFLSQLMCEAQSQSGRYRVVLPLLSLPLYGVDDAIGMVSVEDASGLRQTAGTFMLFDSIRQFAAEMHNLPNASQITLDMLPAQTIREWAAAVYNAFQPSVSHVSPKLLDQRSLASNLFVGLAFYERLTNLTARLSPALTHANTTTKLHLHGNAPSYVSPVTANTLFSSMRAAVGDSHLGATYRPLHGELGPTAAAAIKSACGLSYSAPYLVLFMGYATGRTPLVWAATDSQAVCVAVPVSGQMHDLHTQQAHAGAVKTRDLMASQVSNLKRRVKFINTGSVELFHTDFLSLYKQARAAFERAFVGTQPAAVVLVFNHYHALFDYNIPKNLYMTWCERIVDSIITSTAQDQERAERLRVWSTSRVRSFDVSAGALPLSSEFSRRDRFTTVPTPLTTGVLPDETVNTIGSLSSVAWISCASNLASTVGSVVVAPSASRGDAVAFAERMLQQLSDDTLRAWADQPDEAALASTRIQVIMATAGYHTVSLAAALSSLIKAWASARTVSPNAQQIDELMRVRAASVIEKLSNTMALASRQGDRVRLALGLIVDQLAEQGRQSLIAELIKPIIDTLRGSLTNAGVISSQTTVQPLSSTLRPLLSSSISLVDPPSPAESVLIDRVLELAPEKLATDEGRHQITDLIINVTISAGVSQAQLQQLRNPVIDVDVLNDGITGIRSRVTEDGSNCMEIIAEWVMALASMLLVAEEDRTTSMNNLVELNESIDKVKALTVISSAKQLHQRTANLHHCLKSMVDEISDERLAVRGMRALAPAMVYMQMIANVLNSIFYRMSRSLTHSSFGGVMMGSDTTLFEYIGRERGIATYNISRLQQLIFTQQSWILPFTAGLSNYTGGEIMQATPDAVLGLMARNGVFTPSQVQVLDASRITRTAAPAPSAATGSSRRKTSQPQRSSKSSASAASFSSSAAAAAAPSSSSSSSSVIQRAKREGGQAEEAMLESMRKQVGDDKDLQVALAIATFAIDQIMEAPLLRFDTAPLGFMASPIRLRQDVEESVRSDPAAKTMIQTIKEIAAFVEGKLPRGTLSASELTDVFSTAIGSAVERAAYGFVFDGFTGAVAELNEMKRALDMENMNIESIEPFSSVRDPRLAFESTVRSAVSRLSTQFFFYRQPASEDVDLFRAIDVHPDILHHIRQMYARKEPWRIVELLDTEKRSLNAYFVPPANPMSEFFDEDEIDDVYDDDEEGGDDEAEESDPNSSISDVDAPSSDGDDDADGKEKKSKSRRAPKSLPDEKRRKAIQQSIERGEIRDYGPSTTYKDFIRLNGIVFNGDNANALVLYKESAGTGGVINQADAVQFFRRLEINGLAIVVQSILASRSAKAFKQSMRSGAIHPLFAIKLMSLLRPWGAYSISDINAGRSNKNIFANNALPNFDDKLLRLFERLDDLMENQDEITRARTEATIEYIFGKKSAHSVHSSYKKQVEKYQQANRDGNVMYAMMEASLFAVWYLITVMLDDDLLHFFRTFPFVALQLGFAETESFRDDQLFVYRGRVEGAVVRAFVLQQIYAAQIPKEIKEAAIPQRLTNSLGAVLSGGEEDVYAAVRNSIDPNKHIVNKQLLAYESDLIAILLESIRKSDEVILSDMNLDWILSMSEEEQRRIAEIGHQRVLNDAQQAIMADLERQIDEHNQISESIRVWHSETIASKTYTLRLWRKGLRSAVDVISASCMGNFLPRYIIARYAGWTTRIAVSLSASPFAWPVGDSAAFLEELHRAIIRQVAKVEQAERLPKIKEIIDIRRGDMSKKLQTVLSNLSGGVPSEVQAALIRSVPVAAAGDRILSESVANAYVVNASMLSIMMDASETQGVRVASGSESVLHRLRVALSEGETLTDAQRRDQNLIARGQVFLTEELVKLDLGTEAPETITQVGERALQRFATIVGKERGQTYANLLNAVINWIVHVQSINFTVVYELFNNMLLSTITDQQSLFDLIAVFLLNEGRLAYFVPVELDEKELISTDEMDGLAHQIREKISAQQQQ